MKIERRDEGKLRLVALSAATVLLAGRFAAGEPAVVPPPADPSAFNVRIAEESDAALVRRAVSGAFRSLGDGRCQRLLTRFQDAAGRTLHSNMEALGATPQGYLRYVLFYDGSATPACRGKASRNVFAATAPGSRVVLVCLTQFRAAQTRQPFHGEAVVIHEMLHTLGLGENPPTSEEITRQVMGACAH